MPPLEETVALIDAVGTSDVRAFAGAIAENGQGALALYGPVQASPTMDELTNRLAA